MTTRIGRRKNGPGSSETLVWVTGGAVTLSILMLAGLVLLVAVKGLGYFWPEDVARIQLSGGGVLLGEITAREVIPAPDDPSAPERYRIQLKVGNRDVYGLDFRWVDEEEIASISYPEEALVLERRGWGNLYGTAVGADEGFWAEFHMIHARTEALLEEVRTMERVAVARINRDIERARMRGDDEAVRAAEAEFQEILARINALRGEARTPTLAVALADGSERLVAVADIVRAYRPNAMRVWDKLLHYFRGLWAFVSGEPRESNTEGGIYPALFGTVMMALIMTVAVVPVGVLAAVYLKEYAKEGWITSALRIAVRNLAGVPSIVFGVFGMGFFIYFVGGGIDRLFFPERLPAPTFGTGGILWASLTLALLTLPVVIVATEVGLGAVPQSLREASYALGATHFETVWRTVVPHAVPGILTGMILGIARAVGEVAPLMLTGVVKLAPELPIDGHWPFIHLERKFMHLGFFIYDLGFQSPNVEAARPMVFATTLALLAVVVGLNVIGIVLRNRVRAKRSSAM